MNNQNPYAAPNEQPVARSNYRLRNTIAAIYYSLPSIVGGVITGAISTALFVDFIQHARAGQISIDVGIAFAIAALALTIKQFRTAWMFIREGWNTTTRPIELPKFWGDFSGSKRVLRRKLPDDFDPEQIH